MRRNPAVAEEIESCHSENRRWCGLSPAYRRGRFSDDCDESLRVCPVQTIPRACTNRSCRLFAQSSPTPCYLARARLPAGTRGRIGMGIGVTPYVGSLISSLRVRNDAAALFKRSTVAKKPKTSLVVDYHRLRPVTPGDKPMREAPWKIPTNTVKSWNTGTSSSPSPKTPRTAIPCSERSCAAPTAGRFRPQYQGGSAASSLGALSACRRRASSPAQDADARGKCSHSGA